MASIGFYYLYRSSILETLVCILPSKEEKRSGNTNRRKLPIPRCNGERCALRHVSPWITGGVNVYGFGDELMYCKEVLRGWESLIILKDINFARSHPIPTIENAQYQFHSTPVESHIPASLSMTLDEFIPLPLLFRFPILLLLLLHRCLRSIVLLLTIILLW